jgi:nucleosome assembly protein 1-like 1
MDPLNASLFKFNINNKPADTNSECESEESHEDYSVLNDLPASVVKRVLALESLHEKRAVVEAEFKMELALLEKKYEALYEPIYRERSKIVNGEREATEEEYGNRLPSSVAVEEESEASKVSGIPKFWLQVIARSDIGEVIQADDEEALEYLRDIRCERAIEGETLKLTVSFDFNPNPFFEGTTLNKSIVFNASGDRILDVTGSPVEWKAGKNLCVEVSSESVRHRRTGAVKKREKTIAKPSFFHIFDPISLSCCDEEGEHDHDHDDEEENNGSKFSALEIAEICSFLDKELIPEAVNWYTLKAQAQRAASMSDIEFDDYSDESDGSEEDDDDNE